MDVTLGQIESTISTYQDALKNNPLTEEEKKECIRQIEKLRKMKRQLRKR